MCIEECPDGFICSQVTLPGGDIIFVCKPEEYVPSKCQTHEDCGPGFICAPVNLPGGNIIFVCIPEESVPSKCQTDDDCDDFNPCMDDWCNPETGACHHSDIDCDDGNPETYDFCISWGVDTPHCINDWLCKEDGDLCTLPSPNACTPWPKTCDDGKPCTTDICDPTTGDCINTPDECPSEEP